jgi:hypothetical protein
MYVSQCIRTLTKYTQLADVRWPHSDGRWHGAVQHPRHSLRGRGRRQLDTRVARNWDLRGHCDWCRHSVHPRGSAQGKMCQLLTTLTSVFETTPAALRW